MLNINGLWFTLKFRELGLAEFQSLAINKLNLNQTMAEVEEKFHEIDKNKNGKLSTREFVDYFLQELSDGEQKFKEEYNTFDLENQNYKSFEHALLLFETMEGLKSSSKAEVSLKELLEENSVIINKVIYQIH